VEAYRPAPPPAAGLRVAFITTFVPGSESIEMLKRTLISILVADYPHDTWLLDEGDDPQARELCARLGVRHFSRKGIESFNRDKGIFLAKSKGGNHNAWYVSVGREYDVVAQVDGTTGPCHEYTCLSSGLRPCPGCQLGYHTYSVVIDRRHRASEQIRWYLDGRPFFTVGESQVGPATWTQAVDHGFSIILDLAIGGKYPDSSCRCTTPNVQTTSGAAMSVQYVRVYRGIQS
jgi:hypothetical protein